MPTTDTPLRYPGGKSQLVPFVVELMRENNLFYGEYAEPFAGGSGIAMSLLLSGFVDQVHINDIDRAVYSFWHSVLNATDALCVAVENIQVTIDEWHRQRDVLASAQTAAIDKLGFATLFLNRTNRSGILTGGVIGGRGQTGTYKLDCRFNKIDLIRKIRRIASYKAQIHLSNLDALAFIDAINSKPHENMLVNIDPPYFKRGKELYTSFYRPDDHAALASAVIKLQPRWMVTYDDTPEIRNLYSACPTFIYGLNYSAQDKRVGTELMVVDHRLQMPASINASLSRADESKKDVEAKKFAKGSHPLTVAASR